MKEKIRKIPLKNYIILGVVLLVSLFLVYYFYNWFSYYRDTKYNTIIMDKYLTVINYNELDNYLVENPNSVIYVSKLGNKKIREFEDKFNVKLKNKKISNSILYMDLSEELKNKNILKDIDNKYSLKYGKLSEVPNICIFENGKLKLIYSVKDNKYDVSKLEDFLNNIKFNNGVNISD